MVTPAQETIGERSVSATSWSAAAPSAAAWVLTSAGCRSTSAPLRISRPTTMAPGSFSPPGVHGTRSSGTRRLRRTRARVTPEGTTMSSRCPSMTRVRYETDADAMVMLPLVRCALRT